MSKQAHDLGRGACQPPTVPQVLRNPLDFVQEDHMRKRNICTALDDLARAGDANADLADRVSEFLSQELPLHMADEEEDLFPLLRRRCTAEDEVDRVLRRLDTEHRHFGASIPMVLTLLARISDGAELSGDDCALLTNYANQARRHLILENAIVLPLARVRLTDDDLDTLRLRMMQRRGLDSLMEQPHVE